MEDRQDVEDRQLRQIRGLVVGILTFLFGVWLTVALQIEGIPRFSDFTQ